MNSKNNRRTPKGSTAIVSFVEGSAKVAQKARIRQHLLDGKPITPIGALELYGSFSLGKIVGALRRRGMAIRTQIVLHPSTGSRFARYTLIQKQISNGKRK